MVENILVSRGAGRLAERLADVTEPGRVADMAGYSPDLSLAQKVEVLETLDVAARLRLVIALVARGAGRPHPARADQERRRGGHGEDPA